MTGRHRKPTRKRKTLLGAFRPEDEQKLIEAYGKTSEELADEAEQGYDVSAMKPK